MKIIAIMGKKGSGKTTFANALAETLREGGEIVLQESFSNALKQMILNAGLCKREHLWGSKKTKLSRMLLQKIGTEIFRDQVDQNFWNKKMWEKLKQGEATVVIIDDVRFLNEKQMLSALKAIFIRILRPSQNNPDEHRSETEQDNIKTDLCIINNRTINSFRASAKDPGLKSIIDNDKNNIRRSDMNKRREALLWK